MEPGADLSHANTLHHLTSSANCKERDACLRIDPAGFQIRHPPPPHELSTYITHDNQLFHTIHMGAAVIDLKRWRLVVDGLVENPLEITFDQLLQLPNTTVTSFHECFGSPLVRPDQAKNLLRIGNVTWTGVHLKTLLDLAGPLPEARYVWSDGLDYGSYAGVKADRYQKDLPLDKARNPEVLLAYRMNDEPLTKERGGPVRLVVCGWYGANSTKWLCRLSLERERAKSPFTTRWYNVADPDDPEGKVLPVWKASPNSMIVSPEPGGHVNGPVVQVLGFAWGGNEISRVQVSANQGENWTDAAVSPRKDFSWQEFKAELHLSEGEHRILARATSNDGLQQPLRGRRNSAHIVQIAVSERGT